MSVARSQPILQSDLASLAALANTNLLPIVNAAIASGDWPGTFFDPWITPIPPTPPYFNPQPSFDFSGSSANWLSELNRIRADLWALIFISGAEAGGVNSSLYLSSSTLVSGPWVVGVNDPDRFPAYYSGALYPAFQGYLFGEIAYISNGVSGDTGLVAFSDVSFWFAANDATGAVSVQGLNSLGDVVATWTVANPAVGLHPTSAILRIDCADTATVVNWLVQPAGTKGIWTAKTLPAPAVNVFLDTDQPQYLGDLAMPLQTNGTNVPVAADWLTVTNAIYNSLVDNVPGYLNDGTQALMATSMRGQTLMPHGAKYNLIEQSNGCRPAPWLVRRDTDFVPFDFGYSTGLGESGTIGTASLDGSPAFFSMAQSPFLRIRLLDSVSLGWQNGTFTYGTALPTTLMIFCKKTGWPNPATGDFDFVVNANEMTLLHGGTPAETYYFAAAVGVARGLYNPTTTYNLNDVVTDGSGNGWLYISANASTGNTPQPGSLFWQATASVTFKIVTQDAPSASRVYHPPLNQCFSYILDGTSQYTATGSTAGTSNGVIMPERNRPIAQNGYCIFKVRARRAPVQGASDRSARFSQTPASGPEIIITLGQNIFYPDGTFGFAPFDSGMVFAGAGDTGGSGAGAGDSSGSAGGAGGFLLNPLTIVIPAGAGESGDVDVFIPVLAGAELVWQCAADVIVEAWANWQPMFHQSRFGLWLNPSGVDFSKATAFECALEFTNFYDIEQANYYQAGGYTLTQVQFPAAVENFNDLEALLNQL